MNYIFTGMKHCGKSTMGRAWAEYLNAPFYDTDDMIVEEYQKEQDSSVKTVREIYIRHGEQFLKEQEFKLMHRLQDEILPASENSVVSLGGGLPINDNLTELLKEIKTVIYLKQPYELLFKRVAATGKVPFLNDDNPEEHFYEICREREKYYKSCADITIEVGDISIEDAKEKIFAVLKKI